MSYVIKLKFPNVLSDTMNLSRTCMQLNELVMIFHAVPWQSVWAAHKNFAVLVYIYGPCTKISDISIHQLRTAQSWGRGSRAPGMGKCRVEKYWQKWQYKNGVHFFTLFAWLHKIMVITKHTFYKSHVISLKNVMLKWLLLRGVPLTETILYEWWIIKN